MTYRTDKWEPGNRSYGDVGRGTGDLGKDTGVFHVSHRGKMSADMEEEIVLSASKVCTDLAFSKMRELYDVSSFM